VGKLITADEAAAILGVTRNEVYIRCREGRLPHYRLPHRSPTDRLGRQRRGRLRFDEAELLVWLEANKGGPAAYRRRALATMDAGSNVIRELARARSGEGQ